MLLCGSQSWLQAAFRPPGGLESLPAGAIARHDCPPHASSPQIPRYREFEANPPNSAVLARYHLAMDYQVGILVIGDNHFIVRGPQPDGPTALALARHWSLIGIGTETPALLRGWKISTREFRENLQWAVIVPEENHISVAVAQLLDELRARGVEVTYYGSSS